MDVAVLGLALDDLRLQVPSVEVGLPDVDSIDVVLELLRFGYEEGESGGFGSELS